MPEEVGVCPPHTVFEDVFVRPFAFVHFKAESHYTAKSWLQLWISSQLLKVWGYTRVPPQTVDLSMSLWVRVYVHVCMRMCEYASTCAWMCMCVCMWVSILVTVYVCVCEVHMSVHVYVCARVCMLFSWRSNAGSCVLSANNLPLSCFPSCPCPTHTLFLSSNKTAQLQSWEQLCLLLWRLHHLPFLLPQCLMGVELFIW